MNLTPLPRPLRGIIPPLVTPLSDQDQLDVTGLERLLQRVLDGGVHGVFILGTTGEGPSLAYSVRHQLVERVCDQVAGRVPVLVGITDTAWGESMELAQKAYAAGAAGLVAAPPYYLPLSQAELIDYFEALAQQVPLPLLLYNMPHCTKVAFQPQTVRRLSCVDNIVGLKDSSGRLDYFRAVVELVGNRPNFSLLVGPEELLAAVIPLGAEGGIPGGANLFPRLYVALYEAAVAGAQQKVTLLHEQILRISKTVYAVGKDDSRHLKGIKSALKWLGVCDDYVAQPFRRFETDDDAAIGEYVQELLTLLGQPEATRIELPGK
jgi:4-hydroxy-tetrahydrodipicolinate synthase